jgi:hypothetical protein
MNRVIVIVIGCAALATSLIAQTPKYGVTVKAEKNVDFSKFKTYSWTQGQPSPDKTIDGQIVAAVDREMGALGMSKASSGTGDVMATYYSLSRTDVNLKGKPDASGALPQYPVGTLMVGLLEPGTRRRLLQLRIDRPLAGSRDELEGIINSAVAELFAKYPTRVQR